MQPPFRFSQACPFTGVKDLSPLAGLRGLQVLHLVSCECLTDLSPVAELQNLYSLDLSEIMAVTDLSPLATLYEIHNLWQKSQEDADFMAERLIPIILPEVKIEKLRDRAPYVRYWKQERGAGEIIS